MKKGIIESKDGWFRENVYFVDRSNPFGGNKIQQTFK